MVEKDETHSLVEYTFLEFEKRCREIAEEIITHSDEIKDLYGVPRGV